MIDFFAEKKHISDKKEKLNTIINKTFSLVSTNINKAPNKKIVLDSVEELMNKIGNLIVIEIVFDLKTKNISLSKSTDMIK